MDGWTEFSEDDSEINNQELAKINRAIKQSAQKRQQLQINFKTTVFKEKYELSTQLSLALSKKNLAEADSDCDAIKEVVSSKDLVESQIEKESNLSLSLDQQILQLSEDKLYLSKKLSNLTSDAASNAKDEEVKVSILKNRLHQQMLSYNSLLAVNKDKKHKIQHLRGEHVKFQNHLDRLEKSIQHKRSLMAAMVDEGNLAFENQEDARQRAKALLDKNEKDILQHSLEYRELQRHLDHEEITECFMDLKSQDKAAIAQEAINKRAAILLKSYLCGLRPPSDRGANCEVVKERKIEREIEAIGHLKYKIERLQSTNDDDQMSVAMKMSELTSQNGKEEENLEELKKQLDEQNELFTNLFDAIQKLSDRMGCNTTSIRKSLGDNDEINESNVLRESLENNFLDLRFKLYLKLKAEQDPTAEKVRRSSSSEFEKDQEKVTDVIIPPALEDMDKFEDDLLSPETARAKAIEAMTKRNVEKRRTTVGDDWAAQQQRTFSKRADRLLLFNDLLLAEREFSFQSSKDQERQRRRVMACKPRFLTFYLSILLVLSSLAAFSTGPGD
ncbi:Oidioi.mRNA.OKI2018_I69.XSR.g13566.t2.cds [Oikopleura dioica]|uniref:Oidioi.mRNA.OKI2018_I69.XSR.g13566.t2.cds n=1 Tax=Oikopleura dioica TaxID=34765 RepID=A0ABN7S792_OIKDI|nr:Oidioi.mRNA.OKI2018_I69.XSR.g13566.t2.cds [Oikopleura dioica]